MMLTPEIQLTLKINQQLFTDTRRIALLKAIDETGSLVQAAKRMGISYKTAWDAMNAINQLSKRPFLVTSTGGKRGGGTVLTPYAIRFIQLYDLLTQWQHNAFTILSDDKVPLDDILDITAKLSLQTSARNQLYGTVKSINMDKLAGVITVLLSDDVTELDVYITKSSAKRLKLGIEKTVMLLVKAPLIDLYPTHFIKNDLKISDVHPSKNCFLVKVESLLHDENWCDITFRLPSGLRLYASKSRNEIQSLNLTQNNQIALSIHPEHILIATLV